MNEMQLPDGTKIYYEFDPAQDMLYILLQPEVGPTYYEDVPDQPGVMLRRDTQDGKVVGMTVYNVQQKLMRNLVAELCERVLQPAA